ncbi:MAG: hypothetical protein KA175_02060 [Flavobacteriales bacterium]|nr:hypothetical protein [Flavobacteriales bacterium]MBP6696373.1 hypothetical protein [Flavobacteriales bacterium]
MIRLLCMFLSVIGIAHLHAQPLDTLYARFNVLPIDTLLLREKATTDPRVKFVLLSSLLRQYLYLDRQEDCMSAALSAFELADAAKNDTMLGLAHYGIGVAFTIGNDINAALKHHNLSFEHYARAGDSLWMGASCKEIAVLYQRVGDNDGAMRYMRKALIYGMPPGIRSRGMGMLAKYYLVQGDLDSALYYVKQVDMVGSPGDDPWGYANSNGALATVYAARRELDLAELHFKRTIAVADSFQLPVPFIQYATGYSTLLTEQGRTVEALTLAQMGFRAAEGIRTPSLLEKAADALADAYYANGMADSAFVYAKRCIVYRDSVTVTQNRSQLKSQLFAQQIKDIEDAKLKAEEAAARSRNIQFGIIALIVITLGIFLLIFSRTSVVGAKTIKNLSLIALLLFFEFINLLLHPFLDRITGHSPILMLLCMAAIAGLLIPLHHRMEKLITNMLVSKNNRVRLEAARRTIEELEAQPSDTNAS